MFKPYIDLNFVFRQQPLIVDLLNNVVFVLQLFTSKPI